MNNVKGAKDTKMRVSREQVAANRRTILEAAGRLFKARGFESVTVAEIMQEAGLTHGGFYGYFNSKDELIAAALAEALASGAGPDSDLTGFVARYLSRSHRDNRARGCPVAALAAETIRQPGGARRELTIGVKQRIDRLSRVAPGDTAAQRRRAAIGSWAAMVGAMILARATDDPNLSGELLDQTRGWLQAQDHGLRKARNRTAKAT